MTLDSWNCPITADGPDVAVIDDVVTGYVTMAAGLDRRFAELAAGPPLAKVVLAQLLVQAHRPEATARARSLVASADRSAGSLTIREQGHLDAARRWTDGDLDGVIDVLGAVLAEHPTDVLALRHRYLLLFNAGRVDEMVQTVTEQRPAWSSDLPLASYLDGMESFALEELGRHRPAEDLGRRGVDADPTDLWAIHAVAHVLLMEDRTADGVAWFDGRDPVLEAGGGFAGHLWWHGALVQLAAGRTDDVVDAFDRRVYPGASQEGLDLSNAISLLARLEVAGVDVGDRWDRVVDGARARLGHHTHPFNDTHYALALARAGCVDDAERLVAGMERWADGAHHASRVLRHVGVSLARGLVAYGQGRWGEAVPLLEGSLDEAWRLGGSHAQRRLYPLVASHARDQATA